MALVDNILFPVDFSPSCVAMASYVKRAAVLFGAKVSLIYVFDLMSHNGFELIMRPLPDIEEEHRNTARSRLDSFLKSEFPESPRILVSGDAATEIAQAARDGGFNLIIMPTHAGLFRRTLLGSTTAKVLNDADCPVLTSDHTETITLRPLDHREWLCAIGLGETSERVLRYASQAAAEAGARLTIIHAVQAGDPDSPAQLDLEQRVASAERQAALHRIADLQRKVGSQASVRIAVGSVKEALLGAVQGIDADVLIIGRSPQPGAHGRMRDLTYAMVRNSPFPVLSV